MRPLYVGLAAVLAATPAYAQQAQVSTTMQAPVVTEVAGPHPDTVWSRNAQKHPDKCMAYGNILSNHGPPLSPAIRERLLTGGTIPDSALPDSLEGRFVVFSSELPDSAKKLAHTYDASLKQLSWELKLVPGLWAEQKRAFEDLWPLRPGDVYVMPCEDLDKKWHHPHPPFFRMSPLDDTARQVLRDTKIPVYSTTFRR